MAEKKYLSDVLASVHQAATDLHGLKLVDNVTMREFDKNCLVQVKTYSPRAIVDIRKRQRVSQPVFAAHLNVSVKTVSAWEQGKKKPAGTSLKLLNIVDQKGLGVLV